MDSKKIIKDSIIKACSMLKIPYCSIAFKSSEYFPNKDISAAYLVKANVIVYNIDWLNKANEYEIFVQTAHEIRHYYQVLQYKHLDSKNLKYIEDRRRIFLWHSERLNYKYGIGLEEFDKEYLKQDIEIDAYAFASFMYEIYYGFQMQVPSSIENLITDRKKEFIKYLVDLDI